MSKEVRITLSDEEFEELESFKKKKGLTWKGVLLRTLEMERRIET